MYCSIIYSILLISPLIVFRVYSQDVREKTICLRPYMQTVTGIEDNLEKGQVDLREKNEYVYRHIPFKKPTVVLGWQISGKDGMLLGTGNERRGLVTEYKIKCLTRSSDWVFINNSKSGTEVFKSLGNLAQPDTITKIDLANPITTLSLRLYPQLWEGVPFFKLKLRLCEPEYMDAPSMKANATTTNLDSRIIRTPKKNIENPKDSIIRNREANIRLSKKLKYLFHTPADHTNSRRSKDYTSPYMHQNQKVRRNQYYHGSPNMDIDRTMHLDTLRPIYGHTSYTDDKPFEERKYIDSGPTSSYQKNTTFPNENKNTQSRDYRYLPFRYYDKRQHKRDEIDDRPSNDDLTSLINNEFVPDQLHKKSTDQKRQSDADKPIKNKQNMTIVEKNEDKGLKIEEQIRKLREEEYKIQKEAHREEERKSKLRQEKYKRKQQSHKLILKRLKNKCKTDRQKGKANCRAQGRRYKRGRGYRRGRGSRRVRRSWLRGCMRGVTAAYRKCFQIQFKRLKKEEISLKNKEQILKRKLEEEEEEAKRSRKLRVVESKRKLETKIRKLREDARKQRKEAVKRKIEEKKRREQEIKRREEEIKRKLIEEERKRKLQEEARKRKIEEEKRRIIEEERKRKLREEERKRKLEEERKRKLIEEEHKRKLREEERKRKLEEERKRKLEEEKRKIIEEERKRKLKEEERKRKLEEEKRKIEQEKRKQREEERKRRLKEEEKRRQEKKQREEERKRKLQEEERKRKLQEEKRKIEEEARKKIEEERKRKLREEERKLKEEEERKRKLKEEKERKLKEEKRKIEEEARKKIEEERKRKLREEEERKLKLEEERKRKLKEEKERKIKEEKRKIEEEARKKIEEERKFKVEEDRKRKLKEEKERKLKEEKRKIEEEERKRKLREEERKRKLKEEVRKRKIKEEEERKRKHKEGEESKRKIEEKKRKQIEEARKRKLKEDERRQQERKVQEEARKREIEEEKRKIREEERKRKLIDKENVLKLKEENHKQQKQLKTVPVPSTTVQTRTKTEPITTPNITTRQRTTNMSQPTKTTKQPTTPANLTKNTLNEDLKKELIKETEALICKTKPKWRYSSSGIPPSDVFTATGDSTQAWRANGGLTVEPYRFHTNTRNKHKQMIKKIFFQVSFPELTEVFGVRLIGSSQPRNWGCITRFAILYKMAHQMEWVFYRDNFGAARVFDMGAQPKDACSKPMTFSLPVPLRTTDIRIYPDQWSGAPLLHVNFLTCRLEGQTCIAPLLTGGGKLQRLQFDNMDERFLDKNSVFYITITFKKHAVYRIKAVQFSMGPKENSINKFVLQYLTNTEKEKWNSVSDKDGEIMMFSTDTIVKKSYPTTVFFSKPVIAKSMRIYPETWRGLSPMIKVEFLGCTLKNY